MPNSVAKRRSRFAILATFAVVASLFTAALPASAATGDVEFAATYSACVGGATADGGFTDTSGNFADASIDCLKYYGITTGTSATTYSPGASVTRWQMALFLIRAAGPAGITVPAATSQGFTDIASLPQSTQDAINQLAALGISKGTSATTYSPNDVVSRYQMALFLIRFLEVQNGSATLPSGSFASGLTDTGSVSNEAFLAIEKAWDHGITKGTSATLFSPYAAVTRDQMAAFIARTLAHTNARPAGVSIQSSIASGFGALSPTISVSVRDAAFQPVANALVDVFKFEPSTTVTSAFKADGTCVTTGEVTAAAGSTVCSIAVTDPATNASGNYSFTGAVTAGKTATFYAWTGTSGATFDNDTTASANVSVVSSPAATAYKVTTSIPTNAGAGSDAGDKIVKYGSSVTITVQLVDAAGNPVAQAAQNVIFTDTVYTNAAEGATASLNSTTVKTDATGKATFTITQADPTTGDDADIDETVAIGGVFTATSVEVEWQDGAAAVTTLILSQDSSYTLASDVLTGASHTGKGTVYDQYGNTMSGIGVQFSNNDELLTPVVRTTNSSGVATMTWNRDDATAEADTLSGVADVDGDGNYTVGAGEAIADTGDLNVYWVVELADGGTSAATAVVVADAANDAIVYTTATIVYYDSNDQFKVGGVAKSYAEFEAAVAADDGSSTIAVTAYAASPSGISQFNYTP